MDGSVRLPNTLWWLQLRLIGQRRLLMVGSAYAVILIGMLFTARSFKPDWRLSELVHLAIAILAPVQCMLLIFGGCNTILVSLNRDHTGGMLVSHRLSPMSGSAVIWGYGVGSPVQMMVLWLVGLVFGSVLLLAAGQSVVPWLVGNGLLVSTSVMLWMLTVCLGMSQEKPAGAAGPMVLFSIVGIPLTVMFPGAGLISGAYAAIASYYAMKGSFTWEQVSASVTASTALQPITVALMVAMNAVLTGMWLVAARNRFRRPDRPGFRVPLGVLLLMTWLVLSGVGILGFERLAPQSLLGEASSQMQFVASLELSLLFALLPVSAACIERAMLIKGAVARSWTSRVPSRLLVVLGPLLICGVWAAMDIRWTEYDKETFGTALGRSTFAAWGYSWLSMSAGLLAVDGFFRMIYLKKSRAATVTTWFLLLAWLLPPGIDYLLVFFDEIKSLEKLAFEPTLLFGCSPLGTLAIAWRLVRAPVVPGLIVQGVLAAVMVAMATKAERREIHSRRAEGLALPGLQR
ncbi:MAG: hypothetical protein ACE5GE_14460 [Phycisphaerae bacterium]